MAHIGEKIRQYRKWKGFTQQQLAEVANKSVMSIRRYESGERTPTAKVISDIARALDVPPSELSERLVVTYSDVIVEAEDGELITVSSDTREAKILSRFQAMNNDGKDELIRQADILLEVNKFRRKPKENPPQD